jgi:hypothetical protein
VSAAVRCAKAAALASVGSRAGAGAISAAAPVGGDGTVANKSAELLPSTGLLDRAMGMGGSMGSAGWVDAHDLKVTGMTPPMGATPPTPPTPLATPLVASASGSSDELEEIGGSRPAWPFRSDASL